MEEVIKLIDEETLEARIREIAAAISKDYQDQEVVMICTLKGAVQFFASLCEKN